MAENKSVSGAYLALVRSNYRAYCYHAHGGRWTPGKAVSFLCDEIQRFIQTESGNAYDILIISMPPQHGKSMTITETLPSWYLMKNPNKRVIGISYNEDFAQLFGRRNKEKIKRLGALFGVSLASSPNSSTEFEIEGKAGGMISRGVLSGITGRPCDLMLIDDPVKNRQEAQSETYRKRIFDEWESSFKSRLQAGAKVIVIQTRWHEDDFAGRLARTEKNVKVINLPCEAGENDLLGRAVGDALCPEIGKDNAWLASFKEPYLTAEGSGAWYSLYQGEPTSAEGNMLKREWWKYYDTPPECIQTVISVDAAFKAGNNNDFVAIQCWGKRNNNIYLLDAIKQHLGFAETVTAIKAMKDKHKEASQILVEDKANGSAVIQMLQAVMVGIIPVNPLGGKVARVSAVSGAIEAGNVYLPRFASFTADFVEECAAFPNGKHDDQVDCMSQALNRLIFYDATEAEEPDEDVWTYDNQIDSFLNFGI